MDDDIDVDNLDSSESAPSDQQDNQPLQRPEDQELGVFAPVAGEARARQRFPRDADTTGGTGIPFPEERGESTGIPFPTNPSSPGPTGVPFPTRRPAPSPTP